MCRYNKIRRTAKTRSVLFPRVGSPARAGLASPGARLTDEPRATLREPRKEGKAPPSLTSRGKRSDERASTGLDRSTTSAMVFDDIRRCDEHPVADFTDEAELFRFVRASRWLSVDIAGHRVLRINVRPPAIALAPLRRRATRSTVDTFRAPPLAALDRARLAARVSSADVRGKILA